MAAVVRTADDIPMILSEILDSLKRPVPPAILLNQKAAARYVGMSGTSFGLAIRRDEVPEPVSTPVGNRWRVADLDAWAAKLKRSRAKQQRVS